MKKEMLRINNLNIKISKVNELKNISLCILEGEIVGVLGLTYSGKDFLVHFLCGDTQEELSGLHVYIEGKRIIDNRELEEKVYCISPSNYFIEDWTVAEYIGLIESGWFQVIWKKQRLELDIQHFFEELNIEIDASKKMKELSEFEKRVVDIVKARWHKKRLLIIEDEFEGMNEVSIRTFGSVMKRLISGEMGVILSSHSDAVLSLLSEKYIIFRKGMIVKKCHKSYIRNTAHLAKFLLGDHTISKKKNLDSYMLEGKADKGNLVYQINGAIEKDGKNIDFSFSKGTIVTFLVLNAREKERLFMTLAGRMHSQEVKYVLNNHVYENATFSDFVKEKIVSVMYLGSKDEVFVSMSTGENLFLPSIRKISSLEYVTNSSKISKMLKKDMDFQELEYENCTGEMEINDLISITLERWYIYNPKMLILLEPFAQCDVIGVSIVKSYIKKFSNRGTAVIIIKSREEYIEDISDQIIGVDLMS